MNSVILIIVITILALALVIIGPSWLTYRAMKKLVRVLRLRNSWDLVSASSIDQIGIVKSFWNRTLGSRDYRPQALQQLVSMQIVIQTPEGKYYLNKPKLNNSRLKNV